MVECSNSHFLIANRRENVFIRFLSNKAAKLLRVSFILEGPAKVSAIGPDSADRVHSVVIVQDSGAMHQT